MATTITAGNATNGGAAVSADNTGILELKTGTGSGTTAMTVNASQNVGIGTATVRAQEHIFGLGQTTAALTDAGNRGGMLRVSDNNSLAGSGGAILFANNQGDTANSVGFAAIKGLLIDGSNNTAGSIAFSTRNASTDTALTERARITYDGNFQFNSGYGSVATAYGCRAWVNFNGTGTVAIRASGNVSSITDNNTGDYTVNFTTAMPDVNYSLLGTTSIAASTENPRVVAIPTHLAVPTASAARILTRAGSATSGTGNDTEYVYIAIFR